MLDHPLLDHIALAERHQLAGGEFLFRRGDRATASFVIDSGRLRLIRHGQDGRTLTLLVAGPGEIFAEAALFSEHYHCDAVADVASTVAVLPKTEIVQQLRNNSALAMRLLALQAQQIQRLRTQLELRNIRSAEERVWQYLLLNADGDQLLLERPLKDMAGDIGLSHEAFYRALATLQNNDRVRRAEGIIYLCL